MRAPVILRPSRFKPVNTPFPGDPPAVTSATPQSPPAAFGVLQSFATSWLAYKGGTAVGLSPTESVLLAGSVVSVGTSLFHKLAQKWHLEDVAK